MRFAYADPPYPGLAQRYYGKEPDFAGEVDHEALIASLTARANGFDGWALSTSSESLCDVLPWVKPIGAAPLTFGAHNTWEPLIVVEGRKLRPGFRDWLLAQPARGGGTLMGRKPLAFCAFLFQQLGMLPGDELVELFPGTGIVSRAWAEYGKRPLSETPLEPDDATYQRRREHGMRLKGEFEPSLRERAVGRVRG